jgi:hypothetical protein
VLPGPEHLIMIHKYECRSLMSILTTNNYKLRIPQLRAMVLQRLKQALRWVRSYLCELFRCGVAMSCVSTMTVSTTCTWMILRFLNVVNAIVSTQQRNSLITLWNKSHSSSKQNVSRIYVNVYIPAIRLEAMLSRDSHYHSESEWDEPHYEPPWTGASGSRGPRWNYDSNYGWSDNWSDNWSWSSSSTRGQDWRNQDPSSDRNYYEAYKAWRGTQTDSGSDRSRRVSLNARPQDTSDEEPVNKKAKKKGRKKGSTPTEASQAERDDWVVSFRQKAIARVQNDEAEYDNVITWTQDEHGNYRQNGCWWNGITVTVVRLDLEAGVINCRFETWRHIEDRDGPVEGAVRPRHLIPLDKHGRELQRGQPSYIPSPRPRPPTAEASDSDGTRSEKGGKGSSGPRGSAAREFWQGNQSAKRPLSQEADTAKSGGGGQDKGRSSGPIVDGKLDLKVMEDLYGTMLAAHQDREMPSFVTELGKHIQGLKDEANRQVAAAASGLSSANSANNKIDKKAIIINLPREKQEKRPEFGGKDRYHTSWETRAASRPRVPGPMNSPDFVGFGSVRLATTATCRGPLNAERKRRKNPDWLGMLPDWEIQNLFDNLKPEKYAPDPNLFSFFDGKAQRRKPHRLDAFIKLATGSSGREQPDIADVVRNAKPGQNVRVPLLEAHQLRGSEPELMSSTQQPPFRSPSPYGQQVFIGGRGNLPQYRCYHGTSLEGALGMLKTPMFTMSGGAGSNTVRKRFGCEFPVTYFAPNQGTAKGYAGGHPPQQVPTGPKVTVVMESLIEADDTTGAPRCTAAVPEAQAQERNQQGRAVARTSQSGSAFGHVVHCSRSHGLGLAE